MRVIKKKDGTIKIFLKPMPGWKREMKTHITGIIENIELHSSVYGDETHYNPVLTVSIEDSNFKDPGEKVNFNFSLSFHHPGWNLDSMGDFGPLGLLGCRVCFDADGEYGSGNDNWGLIEHFYWIEPNQSLDIRQSKT